MTAIRTEHLTHTYSVGTPFQKVAVEDVSIAIGEGEYVGVIGHTGSGKSTLIQHLNGLLAPTSGKVYIGEQDLWADKSKLRSFRFAVGLVFQYPEYQLFGETVYSDIAFGPTNMGLPPDEVDTRVRQAARFVGLSDDKLQKSPFELSGGQKRRVAIAGVLAMDPKGRDKILGEIREYHQEKKNTVLLVSHSMEDIAKNATMALVMNQSRLFCYDRVEEVFGRGAELARMGLTVPQVSRVFLDLASRGLDVDARVYTVEAAAEQIIAKVAGKGVAK